MDSVKRASHRESNQWEWFTLVQLWLLLPLSCIHFSDVIGPAFLVYYILLLPLSIDYLKSNYFSVQKFFLFCIFQSKICFPACLLWSALVSVFVFHCLCFLCLYFFPIKDCLLSIVLKCSRLLSVSVKRRHPASLSSPQNIRRPNLFAINNEARSAALVLCLYCFNYLFLLFCIASTLAAYNILRPNIHGSTLWSNTFQLFLCVDILSNWKSFYFLVHNFELE